MFAPADERPRSGPDLFTFDFWSPRASFGGYVHLWRRPDDGVVWYATAVFRAGEPVVALCDEFPLKRTLELRGNGLWADHNVEEPFGHWSIGLEAFALALDHPADDRGERVPLGYDLDWECDPTVIGALDDGYEQPCRVRGEVLLGTDAFDLDGPGWRTHVGPVAPGRRRHGIGSGTPRWSTPAPDPVPGDEVLGWSLAVTPAGTLRKGLYRVAAGTGPDAGPDEAGFVEAYAVTP